MNETYYKIMEIVETEMDAERKLLMEVLRSMKRTWNPIDKIKMHLYSKVVRDHIVGMDLVKYQIEKAFKEGL